MQRIAFIASLTVIVAASAARAHVNIPGLDANGQCVGDANSDGQVTINELIIAVNNALGSCARLPITLNFQGQVGNQAFACGSSYTGIGTGSPETHFFPTDFRFYISNVRLITAAGDTVSVDLDDDHVWQYAPNPPNPKEEVALLDFENGTGPCGEGTTATNATVTGSAPAGVYTAVQFDLGLPFDLDHGNQATAASPLNFTDLFWSWQQGYRFVKIDGKVGTLPFVAHIGSTDCVGSAPTAPPTMCTHPNVATVTLAGFNPEHSVIVADLAALLAGSNLDLEVKDMYGGCQSEPDNPDCAPIFQNLGLTFPGGAPTTTQTFFHLESDTAAGGHQEIGVAANATTGGALAPHEDFDTSQPFPVPFNECLGGSGSDCTGGIQVFTTVNPGFVPLTDAEPEESSYPLADGTPVTLTLDAVDSNLSFSIYGTQLTKAGDSIMLGQTPSFHADVMTQVQLSGGATSGTLSATFHFSTTSSAYQSSSPFTLQFQPTH